jgi:DNA invertase Pin-like site-specific DNA recombinase
MDKRLIGYARVSTEQQTTDQQVDALKAAGCEAVFIDDAVSGSTTSRPELDRCLASLEAGDVLCVWKLDRLGRSTTHLLTTIEDLGHRGVGFRCLTQPIDTTSSVGRMILGVLAAIAQFERDLIQDRTRAALAAKQRRGERLGRPRSLTPSQVVAANEMLERGDSPSHVARLFRVDRSTLYRAIASVKAFARIPLRDDPSYPERLERYGAVKRGDLTETELETEALRPTGSPAKT